MADRPHISTPTSFPGIDQALEMINSNGLDGLAQAVTILMNTAMKIERERYLQAGHYERSEARQSYANGYKPKTIQSRLGKLLLAVPKTRDGKFYPSSLTKGLRSERALKLAVAQMYIEGVSTRKVAEITQVLCGFEVSKSQVSEAAGLLDQELAQWRQRPLGTMDYVYLDARYERVRVDGRVRSCAVLWAVGVNGQGQRSVLGVEVSLSEAELHWRHFLESLTARGLTGVQLVISDAHAGLRAALSAVWSGVRWQRCQFHYQQNAQSYVSSKARRKEVAHDLRAVFQASDRQTALGFLRVMADKYQGKESRLVQFLESTIEESLTVFDFQESARVKLRTSNVLERLSREVKRRTAVVSIFPNAEACLRLVTALLIEQSEEWESSTRRYLKE